jgi:cleavage and polyadenylation specificity factor subunit 3
METSIGSETLRVTPLGAGGEVGRSCILLEFRGKKVLFDCGIHPSFTGLKCLPFLDETDLATVDLLLVSHFHLDHCAAVPYLTEHTDFQGRVYMTPATKAVFVNLVSDYIAVAHAQAAEADRLFTQADVRECARGIRTVSFHQITEYNGIRFWAYKAGHVLGAAMFMVEIAGTRILYTGKPR